MALEAWKVRLWVHYLTIGGEPDLARSNLLHLLPTIVSSSQRRHRSFAVIPALETEGTDLTMCSYWSALSPRSSGIASFTMSESVSGSLSPSAASVAFREALRTLTLQRINSLREELSGSARGSPRYRMLLEELLLDTQALETSGSANMLRAERNSHLANPINLPSEVLSIVFSMCAEVDRPVAPINRTIRSAFEEEKVFVYDDGEYETELVEPSGKWFSDKSGRLGWIVISHVCTHWRRLIVHLPLLWAKEIGTLPSAIHTMLRRSGPSCPLTLSTLGSSFRQDNAVVWEALSVDGGAVAQRVSEIYCSETRWGYLKHGLLPLIRECPMPLLERLVVVANEPEILLSKGEALPALVAPRLQAAHLTNTAISFPSNSLSSLSICLGEIIDVMDNWWLQEEHLWLILHQCKTTLTHLNLDIQMPVDLSKGRSPFQQPVNPPLDFPNLTTLHYRDQLRFGFFNSTHPIPLFACISYSQSALTVVDVHVDQRSPLMNFELLFSSLLQAGTPSPYGLAVDDATVSRTHTLSIGFFTTPFATPTGADETHASPLKKTGHLYDIFGKETHRLALTLRDLPAGSLLTLLTGLARCIPSSQVQKLSYRSSCSLCLEGQDFILSNFSTMRALQIVNPHEGSGGRLLESLCSRTPSGDHHWHMLKTLYLVRHAKWPQGRHLFTPQNDEIAHQLSQRRSIVAENTSSTSTLVHDDLEVVWKVIWGSTNQ